MKRWAIGSIAFFLTLGIGLFIARQFFDAPDTRGTVQDVAARDEAAAATPNSQLQADLEFKNVNIPEEFNSGDYFQFQPVFEGKAYLGQCELNSEAKGPWLGLFGHGGRYSLESTKVKFGLPQTDDLGTSIPMHFRNSENALFLISHDSRLKPGPVTTLFLMQRSLDYDPEALLQTGFRREFRLDQKTYVIRVGSGTTENGRRASVLVLENERKRNVLYFRSHLVDEISIADLVWVGDLDGDKRLDLLISYFEQNGGAGRYILFLSSFAKKGFLVQPYAFFDARFRGC